MQVYDSTEPSAIPDTAPAVAGYIDGRYAWSQADWDLFPKAYHLTITVFADAAAQAFDITDAGNANAYVAAGAMANRLADRQWSLAYSNRDGLPGVIQGLRAKGLHLTDAQYWPAPGVYLWAADPTTLSHTQVAWAPVQPLMVQYAWMGTYDVSATVGGFPGLPPIPTPVPLPPPIVESEEDMKYVFVESNTDPLGCWDMEVAVPEGYTLGGAPWMLADAPGDPGIHPWSPDNHDRGHAAITIKATPGHVRVQVVDAPPGVVRGVTVPFIKLTSVE